MSGMRENQAEAALAWLAAHAEWAGPVMFVVLFVEALPPIGFLLPLSVVMLSIGALVGTQALPAVPVALGAAAGATTGAMLAYAVARRYGGGLRRSRLLRGREHWFDIAARFFARYGAWALLAGRFNKLLRLGLPLVAGVSRMRPAAFLLYNALSAMVWVSLYLATGALAGRAIQHYGLELAGAALAAVLVVWWLVRRFRRAETGAR